MQGDLEKRLQNLTLEFDALAYAVFQGDVFDAGVVKMP